MNAGDVTPITTPASGITISIQELSKRFNHEWIFRDLTSTFLPGNIYVITGPNGSGKSTLLQTLWGQVPPSSGIIQYARNGRHIPIDEVYKDISIATPYMDLIEEFTLSEQLHFHFRLKKSRHGLSVEKIMEKMSLEESQNKYISNFSSGMKQRLKLGLSFFTESDVIFLDEPGTNLDEQAFEWYRSQLKNLPTECLVFIASNQRSEYPEHAQKISILDYK